MLKRYSIWDKKSIVITPVGEILSPEQWIERYPMAGLDNFVVVGSAGDINGGYFGILSQMVQMYENMGADFSEAETDEEKLEVIEAFEDMQNDPGDLTESTPEERIAAALELQNLLAMPDENFDDPDDEEI